jgi:hypothetical protein
MNQAEPDLGRKGFQPELSELAERVAVSMVNSFLNWRRHLRKDTGTSPDIESGKNLHDWIREQESHEKDKPLLITRKDCFLPTMEPSLTSEPLNEQDVIALFNQLLAGGVIRGIKVLSTNQHQQYDGIFRCLLHKPMENHIYDKEHNPLGVLKEHASEFTSQPMVLEYKYSFDALIEDFEKEDKDEKQIHLVVAWIMGEKWQKRYEITPLLHFGHLQHRRFHGGTHVIRNTISGAVEFNAIILSELISYINDPDSVQNYQTERYTQID